MTADMPPALPAASPVTVECIVGAARYHKVNLHVLAAILVQEGGSVGKAGMNKNGSYDIGPTQINTLWLPELNAHGITRQTLQYNGCVNIYAGAWRLSQEMAGAKTLAEAVGNYHSRTPVYHVRYLQRIRKIIQRDLQKNLNQVIQTSNQYLVDKPSTINYSINTDNRFTQR